MPQSCQNSATTYRLWCCGAPWSLLTTWRIVLSRAAKPNIFANGRNLFSPHRQSCIGIIGLYLLRRREIALIAARGERTFCRHRRLLNRILDIHFILRSLLFRKTVRFIVACWDTWCTQVVIPMSINNTYHVDNISTGHEWVCGRVCLTGGREKRWTRRAAALSCSNS